MDNILIKFVKLALKEKLKNADDLAKLKRRFARENKCELFTNNTILAHYRQMVKKGQIRENPDLLRVLRVRSIRTLSGIASVGVHTKPLSCPGECIYCPSEKGMPKSYLSTQPAVMRGIAQKFDPYKMVSTRLRAYFENGHPTDKCELIVMGGTWSSHDPAYQVWFLKRCFEAFNDFKGKPTFTQQASVGKQMNNEKPLWAELKRAQKKNETAKARVIGLTLETRPDFVDEEEVKRMRLLGATRVELGVQNIYDDILKKNKRGHLINDTIRATKLFKDAGFKITYHLMPGLLGATPKRDLEMFKTIFNNQDFQPDQIKIYPTIVSKHSKLYRLWKQKKYKPYSNKTLKELLKKIKLICPPYIRITRLFRDIPKQSIEGGMNITNIRQIIQQEMKQEGAQCKCIRCREARGQTTKLKDAKLIKKEYQASYGREIFLSFESKDRSIVYAFCRLRLPQNKDCFLPVLQNAAIVRELHTYGELVPLNSQKSKIQHKGFGRRLMGEAEKMAKQRKYSKLAVIAGIGVTPYYRQLGYRFQAEYMVKKL